MHKTPSFIWKIIFYDTHRRVVVECLESSSSEAQMVSHRLRKMTISVPAKNMEGISVKVNFYLCGWRGRYQQSAGKMHMSCQTDWELWDKVSSHYFSVGERLKCIQLEDWVSRIKLKPAYHNSYVEGCVASDHPCWNSWYIQTTLDTNMGDEACRCPLDLPQMS